jgi:S1-C subfamily serine protease
MLRGILCLLATTLALVLVTACAETPTPRKTPWHLSAMVAPVRESVVTIAAYDANGEVSRIGSGFFIDRDGTLVTNFHSNR